MERKILYSAITLEGNMHAKNEKISIILFFSQHTKRLNLFHSDMLISSSFIICYLIVINSHLSISCFDGLLFAIGVDDFDVAFDAANVNLVCADFCDASV